MIRLDIDDKQTGIRGEALSQAMIDHAPAWLVGTAPAPSGMAAAMKAAVKGIIPMVLTFIHKDSVQRGRPLPAPDLKSLEARASIITYAIRYLLDNFAAAAAQEQFKAVGQVENGIFIIDSIISTPAEIGEPSPVAAIGPAGDSAAGGEPERNNRESDGPLASVGRDGHRQDDIRQRTD